MMYVTIMRDVPRETTVDVTVRRLPVDALSALRALAIREGVGDSQSDVLRWAIMQFLKAREAEQVITAG